MKKTLLIMIDQLGLGGAEQQLCELLPRIKDHYDILVYPIFSKGKCAAQLTEKHIKLIQPAKPRMFSVFKLAWVMFRYKPAIIHYYLPKAYLFGSLFAFLTPKSKLLMSRRSLNDYQKKYPGVAARERKLHKKMFMIFANSKAVFNQLYTEEGVPKDRLKLIYNGVDVEKFKASKAYLRAELNISETATVFIFVANLFFYKGHADLLQALKIARKDLPQEWHLLCVGRDAGEKSRLQSLTNAFGLKNNIQWLGERKDIPDLLSISNIALLCSHQEGFSNSILEAMASGLPLIATKVGGNAEAVIDNQTGIIVPPKNPVQLARALVRLSTSTKLQKEMGEAGFKRAREHFSIQRCVEQYKTIYSELLA